MKRMNIALAGNPNSGKTTLFNALTGARQHVGNWPGVTVERIEGEYADGDLAVSVTDLPGIYSFTSYSIDEKVSRDHMLKDKPELVVNILDATNLERNLFLTTQLLEMKVPLVVVLSMTDIAKKRRVRIEVEHLSKHLGCPVIPIVASKKKGIDELKAAIREVAKSGAPSPTRVEYDSELEAALARIVPLIDESSIGAIKGRATGKAHGGVDARWLALRLLEEDDVVADVPLSESVSSLIETERHRVEQHTGDEVDIVVADGRYGFIHGLASDVVHRDNEIRKTVSDSIDKVILHRALGIPLFLLIMYVVFSITINVGAPFIDFFDACSTTIFVDGFRALLTTLSSPEWLIVLLADSLGGGIATVSTFIPPIFLIFFCLATLEDSGYMARAAFVMDRLLRSIGLPGKAFIPMLVGFGCNVPAIMATRTLENERDRVLTIMMNPLMSCGARLPVYTLFIAAFFAGSGGTILFALYFTGIILAIATGLVFKRTILTGKPASFVMELPPYHLPTLRGIMFHTWNRLKGFLWRAGKAILAVVIILNFLGSIGTDGSFGNQDTDRSVLSAAGKTVAPVFYPMGLKKENWPGAVGLFTGLFAKESVVGTLDTLYTRMANQDRQEDAGRQEEKPFRFWGGIADAFKTIPKGFEGFTEKIRNPLGIESESDEQVTESLGVKGSTLTALSTYFAGKAGAFAYLLFILTYAPCVAAIAAIYRETSLRWALFAVGYLTSLAWIVSTACFQTATFSQTPGKSAAWLGVCIVALAGLYTGLKARGTVLENKKE